MTQSGSRRTVEFRFEVDADTRGLELFQRELGRLDRATSIADSTLQAAGREVRSFLDTLQQSPRNITLARNALSALSNAATINSTAFRELRGSAAELTEALRNVQATARQVATQAISKVPDTANQQIRSLREGLRGLRADSQAYFNTLREIETRQAIIRANEGRARTWATQAAFSSPTMTSGYGSEAQLQSFARTPAGYNQRISELQQQLANTSFGAPRQSIEREIQRLEGELTALINAGADARINQLAQSAITTRDRLLQVERQLEPLEQQIAARKRRMEELNREIRELGNPQAAALERQIRTRSARGEDVTDLLRQLDGLRPPELLRAQAELAELRAQSDSFVDQQLEIANRNAGRENVDASRMSYNELKKASSELRQELGGLEGQLSELAAQYGRAARAADTYTASTRSAGTASGGTAAQLLTGRRPEQIITPGEAYFRDQVVAPPAMLALPAAGESYGSELRRREQRQRIQEKLYGAETPQQELARLEATLRRLDSKEREYTNTLARIQLLREQIAANVPAPPTRLGPAQLTADQRGYLSFLDAQYGRGPGLALPAAGRTSFRGDYDEFGRGGGAKSFTYQPPSPAEQRAAESSARRAAKIAAQQEYYATGGRGTPPPNLGFGQYSPEAARRYQQSQQPPPAPPSDRNRLGTFFQSAGAISAGSFFGGVEGAVGGALGAAFGGPGAALGAASIGAQVGIIRKALGSTAELEAQLTKYQIALKNVAGSQAEYERGLAAIESANRRLNIPLLEGTQSFTQLAAAVVGAGGKISDAEIAYNAVNSAIKATGGSARDVEGAMLAITQVFSKGKVSAEEIRRQLGDRLPGAFTLFAESIGKSGPELDKLLREGKVGLNELMTFLVDLQKRYGGTAEQIAASSEDAGARLAVAWEQARLAIGDALQPIGAEFQESLAKFLTENQDEIKQWVLGFAEIAKGAGAAAVAIGPAALEVGKFVAALALLRGAIAATTGAYALFTAATTAGGVAITGNVAKVNVLTGAVGKLRLATLALAKAWGPALVLTVGIAGAQAVYEWVKRLKGGVEELEKSRSRAQNIGGKWLSGIGGSAASEETVSRETSKELMRVSETAERIQKLRSQEAALLAQAAAGDERGGAIGLEIDAIRQRIRAAENDLSTAKVNSEVGLKRLQELQSQVKGNDGTTKFPLANDDKDKETEKRLREQERIAAEQRRLAEASAQLQRRLARQVFEYQVELDQKRYENQRRLADLQRQNEINALPADQRGAAQLSTEFERNIQDALQRLREATTGVQDARQQLDAARKYEQEIAPFEVPARGSLGDQSLGEFGERVAGIYSNQAQDIADSFIRRIESEGGFEDIAGLQPLPWQRMIRQAARPFIRLWQQIEDAKGTAEAYTRGERRQLLKASPERRQEVLRRVERANRAKENWDELEVKFREFENRNNPNPRSKPATIGLDAFRGILKEMESSVLRNTIGHMSWAGGIAKGDLSEFLNEKQLQVIRSGVADLVKTGRTFRIDQLAGGSFAKAIREALELENYKQTGQTKPAKPSLPAKPSPSGDFFLWEENDAQERDWLKRYMERTDPPRINPGVEGQFEGASLFKLEKSLGELALASASATSAIGLFGGTVQNEVVPEMGLLAQASGRVFGYRGGGSTDWRRDPDRQQSGYDITLPGGVGGNIPAPSDIKITGRGFQGSGSGRSGRGFGNWVTGEFIGPDGKRYELLLGHLEKVYVNPGDKLNKGEIIGTQGITGRSTGAHVSTHVNALQGGDPWGVLADQVIKPWQRGWSGGTATADRSAGGAAVRARISDMRAETGIEEAQLRLNQAVKIEKDLRQQVRKEIELYGEAFKISVFQDVRDREGEQLKELELLQTRNRLLLEGVKPEVIEFEERLLTLRGEQGARLVQYEADLAKAEANLAKAQTSGDAVKIKAALEVVEGLKYSIENLPEQYQDLASSMRAVFDETQRLEEPTAKYQLLLNQIRDNIEELSKPINQITQLSEGIGSAFGQAFSSIVSGSSSTKEALAGLFGSVADSFAQMASEILAQWIRLQAVKILGQIFNVAAPGGGDPLATSEGVWAAAGRALGNANGNAFAGNGIVPFAYGGVVDQPTFFKFRQGGMLRNGVAGEAGPEAILPLRRLSNGSLGVQASGGGQQIVNNVTVNVDAKGGSSMEGDTASAGDLGRLVAGAVEQALIRHMRPDGVLNRR